MRLPRNKSKFQALYENVYKRYQVGSLLGGDFVKFKENWATSEWGKAQSPEKLARIRELMEDGKHFRVSVIKSSLTHHPSQGTDYVSDMYADVVYETAPGAVGDIFTVPQDIIEKIDIGNNTSPGTPDSMKRPNGDNIQPEEVEVNAEDNNSFSTEDSDEEDRKLHDKNVKMPNAKKPTTPDGKDQTVGYVKHLK